MRALVLLCLLHAAFGKTRYSWDGPLHPTPVYSGSDESSECLRNKASCGCCLMQRHIERMEQFFNASLENLTMELTNTMMALDNMRASRSAFSVSLGQSETLRCYGPFSNDTLVVYNHIFINLGGGYNVQTGTFTVPRSGVYSLSVTVYSDAGAPGGAPGGATAACAALQVNGQVVSTLQEHNSMDLEDSATIVQAVKLKAGDQVEVNLPEGCFLCDDTSQYNTFTGFLLYATD